MLDHEHARNRMVDAQIARRGIGDERLLAAFRSVPRHEFVEPSLSEFAYQDCPLPIGEGQTISQPYMVALMIDAAALRPGDRVLEIGTGSGYAAAIMARMAGEVYAIERREALGAAARATLARLGFSNVELVVGDGTRGLHEKAPFDAIIVAAGGPSVPEALRGQLAVGGRLVIPVGDRNEQRLMLVTRLPGDRYREDELGAVRFVPLIGEAGWDGLAVRTGEPDADTAETRAAGLPPAAPR